MSEPDTRPPPPDSAIPTYDVDAARSRAAFSLKYLAGHIEGVFTRMSGSLRFDPDRPGATSARITVDARSLDTGHPERDRLLRAHGFLDAQHHPDIIFISASARPVSPNVVALTGDLTLHGRTREVALEATSRGVAEAPGGAREVPFTARARISRRDFGITLPQVLDFGGFLVSDHIELTFEIRAVERIGGENPRPL